MDKNIPTPKELALFQEEQKLINSPEIKAAIELQSLANQVPVAHAMGEAEAFCNILKREMIDFQNKLNFEQDLGLQLTNYGKEIQISVTDVGYIGPSLIYYTGFVNGNKCQLIQHTSQINFLLIAVPKPSDRPASRIGF